MKKLSIVLYPARKPACSSAMMFSACGLSLDGLQHDFTWVVDEAYCTVVLTSVMTIDWVHGVGQSPVCQILL